jgi:hypothetical protein
VRNYHGSIAVGHYTRLLGGKPQPVAVLYAMWLQARDPFAEDVYVKLSLAQLEGLVPHAARLRQLVAQLKDVGAIERAEVGFKLCKPDDIELDEPAIALLESAQRVTGNGAAKLPPRAKPTTSANETLVGLDKQRSDVRDVIARMADIKPNQLTYSGKGSVAVQAAIDWLAETGATWQQFTSLCARVHKDKSADRPKRVEYLFEYKPDKRAYLQRMLVVRESTPVAAQEVAVPAKTVEEEWLQWLADACFDKTDTELQAVGKQMKIPVEVIDRYCAQRLQSKDSSPTTAT